MQPPLFFSSGYVRCLALITGVTLAVFLSWWMYWESAFASLANQSANITTQQAGIRDKAYRAHLSVAQQPTQRKLLKKIDQTLQVMAPNVSSVEVTRWIDDMAKEARLHDTTIRWLNDKGYPHYREKTVELTIRGNFLALERFFKTIHDQHRVMTFSYSQWQKTDSSAEITVIARGHIYQWNDEES